MKKQVAALALVLAVAAPLAAHADGDATHNSVGYGFHNSSAPIGVRWWLGGQKVGIDLGFGIGSRDIGDESLMDWTFEGGVPFVIRSWERVHILLRPGITYTSTERVVSTTPFEKDSDTDLGISAELEAEVFLADNLSVSASHGFGFNTFNPAGPGDSTTNWGTFGNNFTNIGFHFYLWGAAQ